MRTLLGSRSGRDPYIGMVSAMLWRCCGDVVAMPCLQGLWSGNTTDTAEPPVVADFVTAMVKGGPGRWAIKGGDACADAPLTTFYEGVRPSEKTAGHSLPGGGVCKDLDPRTKPLTPDHALPCPSMPSK